MKRTNMRQGENGGTAFLQWGTGGSNPEQMPQKIELKARLYMVLLLLAVLLIFGSALNPVKFTQLSNSSQYLISAVVTFFFAYCCYPVVNRMVKESNKRKLGVAAIVLSATVLAYFHSIDEFFDTKSLSSLTEFSSLLFIFVSGAYSLEVKGRENALMLNDQKTQTDNIIASLDEVIWSVDATTLDVLYASAACYNVWGYTPMEMMADKNTFLEAVLLEDRVMFYEAVGKVLTSGATTCEFRIAHRDKSVRYLRVNARLQKSVNGKTNVISGITIDITKQRLAEIDAAETSKKLDKMLNSINDAFFAIDNNYVITYVNNQFRELYGNHVKALIGTPYKNIAPKELQVAFYNNCSRAMTSNINVGFEEYCSVLSKWFYYKIYPAENGATIYVTDITEQKSLFQQMLDKKAKLEEQNSRLSEIAWIQSHKVRAPLANIMGLVSLLDNERSADTDDAFVLDGIKAASKRLDDIIKEISDKANSLSEACAYEQQYLQNK